MLGIVFSPLDLEHFGQSLINTPATDRLRTIVTANLDHVVMLRKTPEFRDAYQHAWARTIDGAPVALWERLRGRKNPRVPGADLFHWLMDNLPPETTRIFFVTPRDEVGEALRDKLVARGFEADAIRWHTPAMGFLDDPAKSAAMVEAIKDHKASHIFFGVGAPRSEIWLKRNADAIATGYALSCGASLEFYTGFVQRAPVWMRDYGLEWMWRLFSDPRRLAKRYLVASWSFLFAVIDDLRGKTLYAPAPSSDS